MDFASLRGTLEVSFLIVEYGDMKLRFSEMVKHDLYSSLAISYNGKQTVHSRSCAINL